MSSRTKNRCGFTITEMLVVIGLIALLIGILLPALGAVINQGKMTKSMNNMRQIATWMTLYSGDSREYILPSQFDYSDTSNTSYKGKVRSVITDGVGEAYQGTWSDILWTVYNVAVFPEAVEMVGHDYRYDSPDVALYKAVGNDLANPLRSAAENSFDFMPSGMSGGGGGGSGGMGGGNTDLPKPFGNGAKEAGIAGFFAANNFFNSTDNDWYTTAQIKIPENSMYLVDSFAGETIEAAPEPYNRSLLDKTIEVDFRYTGNTCLMLFLDGHVSPQGQWKNIDDLQGDPDVSGDNGRGIRIQNLTSN